MNKSLSHRKEEENHLSRWKGHFQGTHLQKEFSSARSEKQFYRLSEEFKDHRGQK